MEKINIWEEAFKVRSYHMDVKARATITSIAGYLQEVAGNHAHFMGFGYKQMKESGLLWLLTRVKIAVHQYPMWGDEIKIDTWVVNAEKFFSRRDFEIRDKAGKVIVSAISGWMLVNAREKRPQLVETLSRNVDLLKDKMSLNEELVKIDNLQKVDSTAFYKVKYSDLDVVNHVNNIQYYNIVLDTIPGQFQMANHIKSFEINYMAESLFEDELEVASEILIDDEKFLHEIRRKSNQKPLCRAISNWEKD